MKLTSFRKAALFAALAALTACSPHHRLALDDDHEEAVPLSELPELIASGGTAESARPPVATAQPAAAPRVVVDRLSLALFRELCATQEGNVTFSPASVESMLRLLRATAAGATRRELAALPLGEPRSSALRVQEASALFVAEGLRLKSAPTTVYRAPFARSRRRAANAVNAWCRQQTQGLIPRITSRSELTADTRLMALSALYLREEWLRPFRKGATEERGLFHRADGRTTRVPLMQQTANFRYAEGADWQAVALDYRHEGREGEPGYFIGILPKGPARDFAKTLTAKKYDAIRRALANSEPQRVKVTLPRLDLEGESLSLKPALNRLGLRAPFDPQRADFSRLCEEKVALADMQQRCHVLVDEEGTTAAAVTVARLKAARRAPSPGIRFDRPFIWAIGGLKSSAAPVFLGLCEEP